MITGLHATDYHTILTSIQAQADEFISNFNQYNEELLDSSAAMTALGNVDFNPDHQGWSVGAGFGIVNSTYGQGNGYALGTQYVYEQIALNIKGARTSKGNYILGFGTVIGF